MNTLNAHLQVPAELQAILDQIDNMPLHFAELKMHPHPKFPQYDRYLVVEDMEAKSRNEFVFFRYKQVLKDKETGEKIHIGLPTPEWVVYDKTWSYFRDEKGNVVELPLKQSENNEELPPNIDNRVRTPSYKYMLFLMVYHRAMMLRLIEGYAVEFMKTKQSELDQYETI